MDTNKWETSKKEIPKKDWELLRFIYSFNVLTVNQLSNLSQRSQQVVRRRLRALEERRFVSSHQRFYGNKRGRPEYLIHLSKVGWKTLIGQTGGDAKREWNEKEKTCGWVEHNLLVNWFFIRLLQAVRQSPKLSVHYITPNFSTVENDPPTDHAIRIRLPGRDNDVEFIPDGVFTVSDSGTNKTLLFFLEVDMGTETLASPTRRLKDIRQKIINYQNLFRSCHYKAHERYFNARLNGFRLLVVTYSLPRLKGLCQLTVSMPPSDFVWLTEKNSLLSIGLSSKIWIKGGQWDSEPLSIFGRSIFPK